MEIKTRKRLSLFRLTVVIAGFGLMMHLTHRECARVANNETSTMQDIGNNIDGVSINSGNSTQKLRSGEVFHATAYCVSGITRSGHMTKPGLVSADPRVIPLGSIIHIESPLMGGIYQVLDTGELVKGKIVDIFIPSYEKCVAFGRRMVKVKVLRYGFNNEKPDKSEKPKQAAN